MAIGFEFTYQGSRRKVFAESGTDNSTVTMRSGHLAPGASVERSILLGLGLIHISQPLS